MAHLLAYVFGDHVEEQLAFYNIKLPVAPHRHHLNDHLIAKGIRVDGVDAKGPYQDCSQNDLAKWDWYIVGGRWAGYLKLKHGARGELGEPALRYLAKGETLPHGDLSADIAMKGDIDWNGMREHLAVEAERQWWALQTCNDGAETLIRQNYPDVDEFVAVRSHPASVAVVHNSDWYERAKTGWWGLMLDADPVEDWHSEFDSLLRAVGPETLITVVDIHIGG